MKMWWHAPGYSAAIERPGGGEGSQDAPRDSWWPSPRLSNAEQDRCPGARLGSFGPAANRPYCGRPRLKVCDAIVAGSSSASVTCADNAVPPMMHSACGINAIACCRKHLDPYAMEEEGNKGG